MPILSLVFMDRKLPGRKMQAAAMRLRVIEKLAGRNYTGLNTSFALTFISDQLSAIGHRYGRHKVTPEFVPLLATELHPRTHGTVSVKERCRCPAIACRQVAIVGTQRSPDTVSSLSLAFTLAITHAF